MKRLNLSRNLARAVMLSSVLFVEVTMSLAQHEGHTMPAKPASKAKSKPAPKKVAPPKSAQEQPKQVPSHDTHQQAKPEAKEVPAATPSPSPESSPEKQEAVPSPPVPVLTPTPETKPVDHTGHTAPSTAPGKTEQPFYSKPAILDVIYGDNPASYRFFLRFRPGKTKMSGHGSGTH